MSCFKSQVINQQDSCVLGAHLLRPVQAVSDLLGHTGSIYPGACFLQASVSLFWARRSLWHQKIQSRKKMVDAFSHCYLAPFLPQGPRRNSPLAGGAVTLRRDQHGQNREAHCRLLSFLRVQKRRAFGGEGPCASGSAVCRVRLRPGRCTNAPFQHDPSLPTASQRGRCSHYSQEREEGFLGTKPAVMAQVRVLGFNPQPLTLWL